MRHQHPQILGVRDGQGQPVDSATGTAEQIRRAADLGDERMQVGGVVLGGGRDALVVALAATDVAWVVRDHRSRSLILVQGSRPCRPTLAISGGKRGAPPTKHSRQTGSLPRDEGRCAVFVESQAVDSQTST